MTDDSGFQITGDAPEAYEQYCRVFMTPLIDAMLERVALAEGAAVLDVACGTGFAARAALQLVGPRGRVVGVDVNEPMLEVARRKVPSGTTNVELQMASAQALPFEDASFDTVVSNQGIQFFPDLEAALVEMARVTRPGGTVAATSWTAIEDSPYMQAQLTAMSEMLGDAAVATCGAAFTLTGEQLRAAFEAAGLTDVTVEIAAPEVILPVLSRYVANQVAATPWGPAFAAAGKDVRKRIALRMTDMLIEDTIDGSPHVPFSVWLVAGTR